MFNDFIEVLKDLQDFVLGREKPVPAQALILTAPKLENEIKATPDSAPLPYQKSAPVLDAVKAYVMVDKIDLLAKPALQFDTRLSKLEYGDSLDLLRVEGDWAEVKKSGVQAWLEVKNITEEFNVVFPNLRPGFIYDFNNLETIKLRKIIKDEMLGAEMKLPLQSAEYIYYLLKQRKTSLIWPETRPRVAGDWNHILRGNPLVTIGIEPKTSSVMEVVDFSNRSWLAYVESVSPDSTITIVSVGRVYDGEFARETFSHDEWKEWRPVFLSFI